MNEFLSNLCAILSHTLLLESKGQEPLGEAWVLNGGDTPPSYYTTTGSALRAYINQFPRLVGTTIGQLPAMDAAAIESAQRTSGPLNDLQTQLYEQSAPRLAAAGAQADAVARMGSANTDQAILAGPGAGTVQQALSLDQLANPEYYASRAAAGAQIPGLVSGQLTPGEQEAISRSVMQDNLRRGVLNVPSATTTAGNAMQFGDASRQRQLQGLGAATGFLPASRTGFDAVQVALGRPSQSNTGQFLGVQNGSGQQAFGFGSNYINQAFDTARNWANLKTNARDTLDRGNETAGVGSGYS